MLVRRLWAPLLAALLIGGCHHKSAAKAQPLHALEPAKLPNDDIAAARVVGEAAVKEKDPQKLAGMLTSLLARVYVPVVNRSGSDLVTPGILTGPVPKQFWLWEPVVSGIARATTLGDLRPTPVVVAGFAGRQTGTIDVDLGALAEGFADEATKGSHTPLAILGTALDADLRARDQIRPAPLLDPAATLILGVMLVEADAMPRAPAPAASAVPSLPGMPPGTQLPANVQKLLQERQKLLQQQQQLLKQKGAVGNDIGGALDSACGWMGGAFKSSSKEAKWLGKAMSWGSKITGALGTAEKFTKFAGDLGPYMKGANLAGTIMDGLTGMGIAAFIDVQGDVRPTRVAYGDGPAKYRILVQSALPVEKDELSRVVKCLEATDPSGTMAGLEDLPPHGPVKKVIVDWHHTGVYDPKHGKFTTDKGEPITLPTFGGHVDLSGVAHKLQGILNAGNGELTDSDGKARATFQVRKPKRKPERWIDQTFTILGVVFPFPIKVSLVMLASNAFFNRSMPIALVIRIPGDQFLMHLDSSAFVHPMGMPDKGFLQTISGTVPLHINKDDTITGHGTVQSSYSLDQHYVNIHCTAPAGTRPLDVDVSGKLLDEKGNAELHLSITSPTGHQPMTFTCTVMGKYRAGSSANGRVIRNITAGTKAEKFNMMLADGNEKELSIGQSQGPVTIAGNLDVRLETDAAP